MLRTPCEDFRSPCSFPAVLLGLELILLPGCTLKWAGCPSRGGRVPISATSSVPPHPARWLKGLSASGILRVALVHALQRPCLPRCPPSLPTSAAPHRGPAPPSSPPQGPGQSCWRDSFQLFPRARLTPPELPAREGLPFVCRLLLSLPPGTRHPGLTCGHQ